MNSVEILEWSEQVFGNVTVVRYRRVMTSNPQNAVRLEPIEAGPKRRHWSRVEQFSWDADVLLDLDRYAVASDAVAELVAFACRDFGIPEPRLKLHARRSAYTGACERPRSAWVDLLGEVEVAKREAGGWGRLPVDGAIRLGRTTTLMTLAHELGHHAVFHIDDPKTPAHGRLWVLRFDQAASMVRDAVGMEADRLVPTR